MGIITKHFFPGSDSASALLLASATFGVSFIARPIGAIVLGIYADTAGRKSALFVVMMLMAVSTAMITFTPTYESIGIFATISIVLARFLQGISAGGDFGSGTAMLVESAPDSKKGLFGSLMLMSQAFAGTMAALCGYAITTFFTPAQLDGWAWRLPFALGLLIVPVGIYIRLKIDEPEEFAKSSTGEGDISFLRFLNKYRSQIFTGIGICVGVNIVQIFFNVYMPVYAVKELGMTSQDAFLAVAISGIVRIIATPIFGALADVWGRKHVLLFGCLLTATAILPCLHWLETTPTLTTLIIVEVIISILTQIVNGATPTALTDLFPTEVRSRGLSVCYNIAVTLFGGSTPFVITWLVAQTHDRLMPGHYATLGMIISLLFCLGLRSKEDRAAKLAGNR